MNPWNSLDPSIILCISYHFEFACREGWSDGITNSSPIIILLYRHQGIRYLVSYTFNGLQQTETAELCHIMVISNRVFLWVNAYINKTNMQVHMKCYCSLSAECNWSLNISDIAFIRHTWEASLFYRSFFTSPTMFAWKWITQKQTNKLMEDHDPPVLTHGWLSTA